MRIKSVMHLGTTFQPSQDQNKCILIPQSFPKRCHLIWMWKSKCQLFIKLWSTFATKVNSTTCYQFGWISFLPWLSLDICYLPWSSYVHRTL